MRQPYFRSVDSCTLRSSPPTDSPISTEVNCASCLATWYTCTPSSLVGTRTRTQVAEDEEDEEAGGRGRKSSLSSTGSMYAAVLPVPVEAQPQISLPKRVRETKINSCWLTLVF